MRLATISLNGTEQAGIITTTGVVPIAAINQEFNQAWPTDILTIIQSGALEGMNA